MSAFDPLRTSAFAGGLHTRVHHQPKPDGMFCVVPRVRHGTLLRRVVSARYLSPHEYLRLEMEIENILGLRWR